MKRIDFVWPEGKIGALTTSWDDATIHDRHLVEILNHHGMKGTFNVNSGHLHMDNRIAADEVKKLYAGQEVAVHTVTHPWLERQPEDMVMSEVIGDRLALEALVGYPVRGMALPQGTYDARVLRILAEAGILYVRPTAIEECRFNLPGNFMEWKVTCHHKADLKALWHEFLILDKWSTHRLFYLWGHSYEFHNDGNWDQIEAFAKLAGKTPDIWFATNMEIYDYVTAWRKLQCSVDVSSIKNTAAVTVWYHGEKGISCIRPGEIIAL